MSLGAVPARDRWIDRTTHYRIAQSSMLVHQDSATGIDALSTGLIRKGVGRLISPITSTSENYWALNVTQPLLFRLS